MFTVGLPVKALLSLHHHLLFLHRIFIDILLIELKAVQEGLQRGAGEDYNKLVAMAKNHQSPNPFRRTLNKPLLRLIKLDRSMLRERWVIDKILLEDKCDNEDFLGKLAVIISKPSDKTDGRDNNKLFNFIKDAVKQNPDITFGEVYNMVSLNIGDSYVDADLRKLCREWGFKFAPAKKGRKGRV